jgi:drug/metabolite transporter (DMT)-like permease
MLGSAFAFSLMTALVHLAGRTLPAQEIVLARAIVTLVLSFAVLRARRVPVWGRDRRVLLLRGALGFVGLSCFYYAAVHLPVAEATVLHYIQPAITAVLAAWLLREAPGGAVIASILLSLAGVLLVTRPEVLFGGAAAELDLRAAAIGLGGACFSASAYTVIRRLARTEDPHVVVFYFPLVAVPLSVPLCWPVFVMPRGWDWLLLIAIGCATQVGQVLLTLGLHRMRAARATSISYVQILFAAGLGALFFGDVPGWWTVAGAALIVGGTSLAVWRGR